MTLHPASPLTCWRPPPLLTVALPDLILLVLLVLLGLELKLLRLQVSLTHLGHLVDQVNRLFYPLNWDNYLAHNGKNVLVYQMEQTVRPDPVLLPCYESDQDGGLESPAA